jgi:two-component system probable response regulator PhcQ
MNPTRRILVVDDEVNICNALRRSLRKEGYEILTANEPAQGLEILKTEKVDLVLSDHMMPNMTGLEFLTLVRDRHPDTVRILLTGHADMDTAIKAINDGQVYRFLTKPWDDTELKVTIYLAFEHLDLAREHRQLLTTVRRQANLISDLEKQYPGIGVLRRNVEGAILIDCEQPAAAA